MLYKADSAMELRRRTQILVRCFKNKRNKQSVNDRLRPLTNNQCKGILPLDNITMNELHIKHPKASPTYDDVLIQGPIALVNEVIFDGIDKNEILRACLRTKGAAGVWGLDAEALQRILRSKIFGTAATDL